MNSEIKPFKKLAVIKLFQWEEVIVEQSMEDMNKIVNSWVKFIKIKDKIINISDIRCIEQLKSREEKRHDTQQRREHTDLWLDFLQPIQDTDVHIQET
jgi:hypothetical protein